MRIFIAIELPDKIKKKIVDIQKHLPDFDGKLTEPENLHLTLKFLGNIDEKTLTEVKKRLKKIKFDKFEAKIDFIDVFSPDYIKIIWLHLESCAELHKAIDESLNGLFPTEKRFMSHLTIARVKNIEDREEFLDKVQTIKIPKIKFRIDKFYIKKSTLEKPQPKYETLESYDLD